MGKIQGVIWSSTVGVGAVWLLTIGALAVDTTRMPSMTVSSTSEMPQTSDWSSAMATTEMPSTSEMPQAFDVSSAMATTEMPSTSEMPQASGFSSAMATTEMPSTTEMPQVSDVSRAMATTEMSSTAEMPQGSDVTSVEFQGLLAEKTIGLTEALLEEPTALAERYQTWVDGGIGGPAWITQAYAAETTESWGNLVASSCPPGLTRSGFLCKEVGNFVRGCGDGYKKVCQGPPTDRICYCSVVRCKRSRPGQCDDGYEPINDEFCEKLSPDDALFRCYDWRHSAVKTANGRRCARRAPAVRRHGVQHVEWICPYGARAVGDDEHRPGLPLCVSAQVEEEGVEYCPDYFTLENHKCYDRVYRREECDEGYSLPFRSKFGDDCRCAQETKWNVQILGCEAGFDMVNGECIRYLPFE